MGRPSKFSPKLALVICERLVEGESLRAICLTEGMPNRGTIFRWLEQNDTFRDQYTRAREAQAETFADELVAIADDTTGDWYDRPLKDGETERVVDTEHINRSRLRVDTRKWVASKILAKKYGDKTEHTINGPVTLALTGSDVDG